MNQKSSGFSVRDIARKAGVSKSTAAYVLRNQAGPSEQTRQRVLKVAQGMGYVPDAQIASWMARVRGARSKDLLPIAWLNTNAEKDAWQRYQFLFPYWEGVRERCLELGYRLEELWIREPRMTMRRISQIIYQRGIEGVVVSPPASHLQLDWSKLAGVALGAELLGPRLHRVDTDFMSNLQLALKMLRRFGYRRIGICLSEKIDRYSNHLASTLAHHLFATAAEAKPVPPFFYRGEGEREPDPREQIVEWAKSCRPEVVVCHDNRLLEWFGEEGLRVPRKIGLVHLAVDDDVPNWAGIHSNRKEIGRTAAELVVSLVQNRQFGVPRIALDTVIRGSWRGGGTLLVPKPK